MPKDPYKYFRVEARELLEGLAHGVLQHEKGIAAPDVVARLLRLAHTLKGAARVVKQAGIAELAHTVEGILTGHRDAGQPLFKEQATELLRLLGAPVLVVDDSLTTRMLELSILESAGYDVEVAVSAEEALAKSRDRRYSLFVVDVEMPGMNGFEFVAHTRSDAALRDIPAILVTSRNAVEDRRRGEQVGARAYIVKGEFDQGHLLQTIRSLVG